MGLFDKKYCDICGEKIGLLGNRKLEDGNICKNCAKKLSPFFDERRHSTLEDIKEQMTYREANKERVRQFQCNREYDGSYNKFFLDMSHGWFAIGDSMDEEDNPDIVDISAVRSCTLDIDTHRREERYRDENGEMKDYFPPRYKYSYYYTIKIAVDHPWFDDMQWKMNSTAIEEYDRGRIRDMENRGNEIVQMLSSSHGGAMNGGMNQQMGMNGGMPQRGSAQPVPPVQTAGQTGVWTCSCGAQNNGKFCANCGKPKPAGMIRCDKCGWVCQDPSHPPKFCPECGDPINAADFS